MELADTLFNFSTTLCRPSVRKLPAVALRQDDTNGPRRTQAESDWLVEAVQYKNRAQLIVLMEPMDPMDPKSKSFIFLQPT